MRKLLATALIGTTSMLAVPAIGDDWVAVKLRGRVLQLVGAEWQPLHRGDSVSDARVVRTMSDGRVSFQRAAETIELGADTQIQIHDRDGRRFTTVKQYFGEVAVEAEVRQVQHFAVQTPELVAVVKGTKFVVTSDGQSATVKVARGHVAVEDRDTHQTTTIAARQSVSTSNGNVPLAVSGLGKLPVVYAANGRPVQAGDAATPKDAARAAFAAALEAGLSKKEAEKAAKAAEKEAKDAGKAAGKAAGASAYAAALAAGASVKEAEKAAKSAEKEVKEESKAAEKAADQVSKTEEKASKAAEKAASEATKEAEKAAEQASKAEEHATKEAEKAASEAAKEAEKALKL